MATAFFWQVRSGLGRKICSKKQDWVCSLSSQLRETLCATMVGQYAASYSSRLLTFIVFFPLIQSMKKCSCVRSLRKAKSPYWRMNVATKKGRPIKMVLRCTFRVIGFVLYMNDSKNNMLLNSGFTSDTFYSIILTFVVSITRVVHLTRVLLFVLLPPLPLAV